MTPQAPGPRPESIQQAINLFRHNLEHDQKPKERLVPVNAVYLELLLDYVEQRDAADTSIATLSKADRYQEGWEACREKAIEAVEYVAAITPKQAHEAQFTCLDIVRRLKLLEPDTAP